MDTYISLEQYDALYKTALAAVEQSHFVLPGSLKSVDEMQQLCRICGCMDDGTFVDLDKPQEFEFDSTIDNYRTLFQRTSLQFQFHTMPDLPSRLCAKCGYKAKIFYLLTRQFVLGQYAMRANITEWYHNKYNIEPPEQVDDQKRFQKQLSEAASPPLPALIPATPPDSDNRRREMGEKKPLPAAAGTVAQQGELKRSISVGNRLDGGGVAATAQLARRNGPQISVQRNLDEGQMTRSAVNLKFPAKGRIPVRKLPQIPQQQQQLEQHQHQEQQLKATRSVTIGRGSTYRPNPIGTPSQQCFVTARIVKPGARDNSFNSNRRQSQATSSSTNNNQGNAPAKLAEEPLSREKMQQKLQDQKRRWR